jgi:hypothetical protein
MRRTSVVKFSAALFVLLVAGTPLARAQSAQATNNIIFRVMMIKSQFDQGTIFSIDVEQREYWITAKHILTGAQHPPYGSVTDKSVTLSILNPNSTEEKWVSGSFSVIDPGVDIDIVVLAASAPLLDAPLPNPPTDSDHVPIGGDCEFLGYPFGSAWQASFANGQMYRMPFIKHCTISGQIITPQHIWVLDGINNEGFSGGPVVIFTGAEQRTLAVVSGYRNEPTAVIPMPSFGQTPEPPRDTTRLAEHPKEMVNLNSGFILAFDISYAVDAIKKNPIGPLRKPK